MVDIDELRLARYSAGDLLAIAEARGYQPSRRMITDWVELGLLDRPERSGLGRGRGSSAGTWPWSQFRLFFLLLDKRREVRKVATLCNLPVWLWLCWGDFYAPTRQVRRAMATWSGSSNQMRSWERARKTARAIVEQWASPAAPRASSDQLLELIVNYLWGAPFKRAEFVPALSRVLDPEDVGRRVGVPGLSVSVEGVVDWIEARVMAVTAIQEDRRGERTPRFVISEDDYLSAQTVYRASSAEYAEVQPGAAADPLFGHLYEERTIQTMANQACSNLTTILGLQMLHGHIPT